MAHAALSRKTSTSSGFTESAMSVSAVRSICPRTWCTCSKIAFACGFLIVVGLRLIPYESHQYLKFNLNSLPLSYTRYRHLGYLLNQNLLTNRALQSELLLKISSATSNSLPLTCVVLSHLTSGNSTILNQLDAGSIMVRAMKSMTEPSLPLRVYGPTRSTHNVLHGVVIMVLGGRCPYLSFRFLLTWHVLQDFVIDRMVVLIPFQYIVACIVFSRCVCPGCCR